MAKKFDLAELMGARTSEKMPDSDTVVQLPVEELHDNTGNFYVVDDVKDLCDSIAVSGVLQPILARPRAEGGYTLIAGHRRTKAVRQLRDEWKGKGENPYDTIPAILRPAPATKAEELLEDLALITTNSAARKLTDPELSRQAEKLTDILYGLKQEGYEFPGRMRKLVADALSVSETKLAKQKLIREKLSPGWLERWKAGAVAEYTAEALTKYSPELQEALLFKKKLEPYTVRSLAEYYAKCIAKRTCKVNHSKNCDWGDHFWAVGSRIENEWNRCVGYGDTCCKGCKKALNCSQCCPLALEAAKKDKKRREAETARELAKREQEAAARKEKADILWARFKQLREAAGLSIKQTEDGIKDALEWSPALKPYEARDVDSWEIDRTPEQVFHFKTCWVAARLFGVPVEALTDVKWKPEAAGGGGGLETPGDGEAAARALPQSLRDSSLPEGAGTVEEAAGTGEDLSAPAGPPPLAGEANAGQWPAWISVEDALPPEGVTVLTVGVDGDLSDDHLVSSDNWAYSAKGEITHWMPSPPEPGADRTLPPQGADEGLYWRPFPKVKPAAGQRALVVQEQADYDRLIFEAKLARYAAEENRWYWVSELIPDVEAERVIKWLPEPGELPEEPEEDDDAEYPEE